MPITLITTMHSPALALFPLSHHVIYTALDPRHLPDTTLGGGEQDVDQNNPCQRHPLTTVDTTLSPRAHRKPTRPPAP